MPALHLVLPDAGEFALHRKALELFLVCLSTSGTVLPQLVPLGEPSVGTAPRSCAAFSSLQASSLQSFLNRPVTR